MAAQPPFAAVETLMRSKARGAGGEPGGLAGSPLRERLGVADGDIDARLLQDQERGLPPTPNLYPFLRWPDGRSAKVIMRQMYGRAGSELLKARVLPLVVAAQNEHDSDDDDNTRQNPGGGSGGGPDSKPLEGLSDYSHVSRPSQLAAVSCEGQGPAGCGQARRLRSQPRLTTDHGLPQSKL